MGLPLSLAYYLGLNTYPFPNAQMFYPAAGVMLAFLVTKRRQERETPEESGTMPRRFFIFFIALSALTALCCFVPFVRPSEAAMGTSVQSYVIIAGSILAWIFLLTEGKERRAAYGLRWSGTCITLGVFFAFAYMSTGNIWVPVILHFVNNNLAVVVSGTTQITGYAIGWLDILVSLALNGLIFLPFLAAKVFRSAQTGKAGEPEAELNSRESKSPGG